MMEKQIDIDLKLLKRIRRSWPKRASVRGCYFDEFKDNNNYNSSLPDYPKELVPFWNHPKFEPLDDEIKYRILTWAWMNYNLRTIHAEEKIVNPSFYLILNEVFDGTNEVNIKNVVYQSLIDESFHSLMHYNASEDTIRLRGIEDKIIFKDTITYRLLTKHKSIEPEKWKRDLMALISGIVSETSINAYLSLLSTSKTVQPKHSEISKIHDLDEFAHSSILVEITKTVYNQLSQKQKDFFITYLPVAMEAFCAHDFESWRTILKFNNINSYEQIIYDCENNAENKKLVNDYSGLKRLTKHLGIFNNVNYDFNDS